MSFPSLQSLELVDRQESVEVSTKVHDAYYENNPEFYRKARKYWSEAPATVNGMLGGLGYINKLDIDGSVDFLDDLKDLTRSYALDCGAGIGRVSKHLLLPRFQKVDIVEQDTIFSNTARDYCSFGNGNGESLECRYMQQSSELKGLCEIYNMGLQQFSPKPDTYDLIWSQWVLGHLTDHDLFQFFSRIKQGLTKTGYFVMKENVTSSGKIEIDDTDSSVTRPFKMYEQILANAGYSILKTRRQEKFPKGLYPVYMVACKPIYDKP